MRRVAATLVVCVALFILIGFFAVRHQAPETRAARRAAQALLDSSGGRAWLETTIIGQRKRVVQQVLKVTNLTPVLAVHLTDEVLIPELMAHISEINDTIVSAWGDNLSAHDLNVIQKCWTLFRTKREGGGYFQTAEIGELNKCLTSRAGQHLAQVQPSIDRRVQEAGAAFGARIFPQAIEEHREQLRQEGIVVKKGVTL